MTFVNFKTWSSSYFDRSIAPYYYRIKSGSYDETDLENTNYELELLNSNGQRLYQSVGYRKVIRPNI